MKKLLVTAMIALGAGWSGAYAEDYEYMALQFNSGSFEWVPAKNLRLRIIDDFLDVQSPGLEAEAIPLSMIRGFEFLSDPNCIKEVNVKPGVPCEVFTADGKYLGTHSSLSDLSKGVYIVRQGTVTSKIMKR